MITMYAIPNCDTVKKARASLDKKKIEYKFIDFKKTPPSVEQLNRWSAFFGELPINKKGTTYKTLKDVYEALAPKAKHAFIIANTSMIKRPILEKNDKTLAIGFDEKHIEEIYSTLKI